MHVGGSPLHARHGSQDDCFNKARRRPHDRLRRAGRRGPAILGRRQRVFAHAAGRIARWGAEGLLGRTFERFQPRFDPSLPVAELALLALQPPLPVVVHRKLPGLTAGRAKSRSAAVF